MASLTTTYTAITSTTTVRPEGTNATVHRNEQSSHCQTFCRLGRYQISCRVYINLNNKGIHKLIKHIFRIMSKSGYGIKWLASWSKASLISIASLLVLGFVIVLSYDPKKVYSYCRVYCYFMLKLNSQIPSIIYF